MDNTVHLTRSQSTEKDFQAHLKRLKDKFPELDGKFLSENAVDVLRSEGVEIERVIDPIGLPYYLMKTTHSYPQATHHYVLYTGESDYPAFSLAPDMASPEHPRYQTFKNLLKSQLSVCAALYAQRKAWHDYLIVVKSEGTLNSNPHIHLLCYDKHQNETTKTQSGGGSSDREAVKKGAVKIGTNPSR